jgi:hypothetical protein
MGFSVPLASWIKGPLKAFVADHIKSVNVPDYPASLQPVVRDLDRSIENAEEFAFETWKAAVFAQWYLSIKRA